jgi:phage-related protein
VSGVACYGVEQAKIMLQYAEGDISGQKALELSGRTAIAVIAHPLTKKFEAIGARLGQKAGMAVGAMVSTVLPVLAPVATAVGGFIGGVVGKVAGSAIGQTIRRGAEKIVEVAKPVLKAAWEGVKNVGRSIVSGVKNFFESIFG